MIRFDPLEEVAILKKDDILDETDLLHHLFEVRFILYVADATLGDFVADLDLAAFNDRS